MVRHKKIRGFNFIIVFLLIAIVTVPCMAANTTGDTDTILNLTEEEKEYIQENPSVSIAIDTSWTPYGFEKEDGTCGGIIPNIMSMVAKRAGLKVDFVPEETYADAILACNSGKTTLVSGIANDPKMADRNQVLLTDPYIQIGYSAVTGKDMQDLYEEGANYKVALCVGTYAEVAMQEKMPSYQFVEYHSNQECMDAVLNKETEIALVANYSVSYYSNWHEYSTLQTVQINDFSWDLCFGMNKDSDPLLLEILNKSIATITENDVNQAIYAGATTAASLNPRLVDVIYEHPGLVAVVAGVTAILIAFIVFIIILSNRRAREMEKEARFQEDLQQKDMMLKESELRQAEQASASKTEFFSRMSHDMRTPMNGILGMVELSEDEEDPDVLKENLSKIKSSGEYLLGLINDTLDFQKIESGKLTLEPQVVYAEDLLESIVGMVKPAAEEKGIKFKVTLKNIETNWYVKADPLRMKQIFINLLSNAVKFTPAGGTIEFVMELLQREGMISHERITVTDTGIGMSREFLENGIFQPFSQEQNTAALQTAGTGLGLSIAKKLVELMGGRIEVKSEPGVGTKFSVYMEFERVDDKAYSRVEAADSQRMSNAREKIQNKKILLAEDHPLNAEIAKKLLTRIGAEVTWVKNGKECLDCISQAVKHTYDVILMDIRMPVMDGFESTQEIRKLPQGKTGELPIIAMTANAYADDVKKCLAAGMDAHIAKPVDPLVMYETIAKMLK